MSPKQKYYKNTAESIIKKLKRRSMEGIYCQTKEDALLTAKSYLSPKSTISWGGSQTLEEIGLLNYLKNSDYILYDRSKARTPEERSEIYSKTVTADYYFMSSNAITLDGQLVNIDGFGNRVACLITGPKNVIVIIGMNKLVTDVQTGIAHTQNMAAPPNTVRLNLNTPCATLGRCANCLTEECICCQIVITRKSRIPGRIKVILVGEELGY